jgi:hypothetical protein
LKFLDMAGQGALSMAGAVSSFGVIVSKSGKAAAPKAAVRRPVAPPITRGTAL